MTTDNARQQLFDDWAADYDEAVTDAQDYPFAGYDRVLDTIVGEADLSPKQAALDLGIGTGNVAARLLRTGCTIWGVDFSAEMIALAKDKLPDVTFIQSDLLADWSGHLSERFDCITAAYVLHEFSDDEKVSLLQRLAADTLKPGGKIIIGDVAFPDADLREQAHQKWINGWDETEHYFAADEFTTALARVGLQATYTQVSVCAGVFVITV